MKRWARHDAKKSKELFHIEHSVQFCFPVFCQEVCPLDCGSFKRSLATKETIPSNVTFLGELDRFPFQRFCRQGPPGLSLTLFHGVHCPT